MLAFKTERDVQVDSLEETTVRLAHENEMLKRRLYGTETERLRTRREPARSATRAARRTDG